MSLYDKNGGANHLRAWRRKRGVTQAELAELVDTSPNQITYLESGERGLSLKWLRRLAPALGISVGWLAEIDPDTIHPDILEIWSSASDAQRRQIAELAQVVLRTGDNR